MIQQAFYTLLIMAFLGVLLFTGLYGPPAGQKLVDSTMNFFKWTPPKQEGPLNETETTIKQFDSSFRNIRQLRTMVVKSNKENAEQLTQTYQEVRSNLKQLLADMDQQSPTNRADLMAKFDDLHQRRRQLVGNIISGERSLITLNDQMDEQLRTISGWLSQQAVETHTPGKDELTRGQQYENLLQDLKTFAKESHELDVVRILLMRKSQDYVNQLEANNQKLEEKFNKFSSQIEIATGDQAGALWGEYEALEKEQRQIVTDMKVNQEFIGDNQQRIATGVSAIARSIHYRTSDQVERFQQKYQQLQIQRTAALDVVEEHKKKFLDSRQAAQELKESNEFRMQKLREDTNQLLTQYERLDDYRRNLSSSLQEMTDEIRDNDELLSRQVEDMRLQAQSSGQDLSEVSQRMSDAMNRNLDRMQQLRAQMESAQTRLRDLTQRDMPKPLTYNPYYIRLQELRDRNKTTLNLMQKNEDQLRNAQASQTTYISILKDRLKVLKSGGTPVSTANDRQSSLLASIKESIADLTRRNADKARDIKEKTEEQNRAQKERVEDQMQRLRDQQQDRRN
jgi:hypothetical protein